MIARIMLSLLAVICLCQTLLAKPDLAIPDVTSDVATSDIKNVDTVNSEQRVLWANQQGQSQSRSAFYREYKPCDGSHRYCVIADWCDKTDKKSTGWYIKPIVSKKIASISAMVKNENISAATNAGYFNLSDGVSASYITIDGKEVANPRTNKALTENPKLKPYLEKIFNRSEIRVLEDSKGKTHYDIVCHNEPLAKGNKLVHSLQAGPQLLPKLTLEEEAFVRKDLEGQLVDAIGANRRAARTAFGITKDNGLVLFVASGKGQDPESSGITMEELRDEMKAHGCVKAINLDGGASSTMFVRLMNSDKGSVVCGKTPETRVKSLLGLFYNR